MIIGVSEGRLALEIGKAEIDRIASSMKTDQEERDGEGLEAYPMIKAIQTMETMETLRVYVSKRGEIAGHR